MLRVFCIDVGLVNMGVAFVEMGGEGGERLACIAAERVDITVMRCGPECPLGHQRVASDWVAHFVVRFGPLLDRADVVLIERQPPAGHRCVEQLLFSALRDRAMLVCPRSVHKCLGIGPLDYDQRKVATVRAMRVMFADSPPAQEALFGAGRAHDVADALALAAYYARLPEVRRRLRRMARPAKRCLSAAEAYLDQFAYRGAARRRTK